MYQKKLLAIKIYSMQNQSYDIKKIDKKLIHCNIPEQMHHFSMGRLFFVRSRSRLW